MPPLAPLAPPSAAYQEVQALLSRQGLPVPGLTRPEGLRRFKARLGGAMSEMVYILCFGDSITDGVGVIDPAGLIDNYVGDRFGWPGQLRQLLAARFGTLPSTIITPAFDGSDSRVALGGSPGFDTTRSSFAKARRLNSSHTVTFQTEDCTGFDILLYAGGSGDGSLIGGCAYAVDGGSAVTALASGVNATPGHLSVPVTGLAKGPHSIAIKGLHASNLQVLVGIRPRGDAGVSVGRMSKAGWTLSDALGRGAAGRNNAVVGNAAGAAALAALFAGAYGSHLNIIALGENDAALQNDVYAGTTEPLALQPNLVNYEANLRAAVAAQAAVGGCTLLLSTALPPPGGSVSPGPASRMDFHYVCQRIASDMDHVAHLDLAMSFGIFGDSGSAEAVSLGLHSSATSVHLSKRGYGVSAQTIAAALTSGIMLG